MTDQELIQALRCCANGESEDCPFAGHGVCGCPGMSADLIERLTAENAALRTQLPQWIPVTERLPQKGVDVLVTYPDRHINMGTAGYDDWIDEDFEDGLVTHWMPLPTAPGVEPGRRQLQEVKQNGN